MSKYQTLTGRVVGNEVQRPRRQLAIVIDLNKCIGCQACTLACKNHWTSGPDQGHVWWRRVVTMPGSGSPHGWEDLGGPGSGAKTTPSRIPTLEEWGGSRTYDYEKVYNAPYGTIPLAPVSGPERTINWDEDIASGTYPNSYFFYMPTLCMHCTNPPCLQTCPRDAIYKREEDGIVLVDEDRCNGYGFCVEACPYKAIVPNLAQGVAQKCIMCFPRVEKGVAPACIRQCPGRDQWFGFLDDEDDPVYKLVNEWKVALPLHPEWGTQPNVYYIPVLSPPAYDEEGKPRPDQSRIPKEVLERLFGSRVDKALETLKTERAKREKGQPSELMELLIGYQWPQGFFPAFAHSPESQLDERG